VFFDLTPLLDKTNNQDPTGSEHTNYLTENCCNIIKKTDDRHHQDVIKGTCTIRQVLAFALHDPDAPALCYFEKSAGRVDAMPDAERFRKPARPGTHLKAPPGTRHCALEHPDLCFINRPVVFEPPVILTGKVFKNAA
jgi:hypothetical protein